MKILVIGSDGFIGRNVVEVLSQNHHVYGATKNPADDGKTLSVDLTDQSSIENVLKELQPEVILNCAGVVDPKADVTLNQTFSSNLLNAIAATGIKPKRVVITGSASEYGIVDSLPVAEDAQLGADVGYGLSKLREEEAARELAARHELPLTVLRLFNPIGVGMHPRFLIPSLIRQVQAIVDGGDAIIEVSGRNTKRDYISVRDVAAAFKAVIEHNEDVDLAYNVGSGISTSNNELIEIVVKNSKLVDKPEIVETSDQVEPLLAIQADITLMGKLGWKPQSTVEDTIKEIIDAASK